MCTSLNRGNPSGRPLPAAVDDRGGEIAPDDTARSEIGEVLIEEPVKVAAPGQNGTMEVSEGHEVAALPETMGDPAQQAALRFGAYDRPRQAAQNDIGKGPPEIGEMPGQVLHRAVDDLDAGVSALQTRGELTVQLHRHNLGVRATGLEDGSRKRTRPGTRFNHRDGSSQIEALDHPLRQGRGARGDGADRKRCTKECGEEVGVLAQVRPRLLSRSAR